MTTRLRPTAAEELLARLPTGSDVAVVRDGPRTIVGLEPSEVLRADGPAALRALDAIEDGWWAGFVAYDLGRAIERVPDRNAASPVLPDLLFARFETRVIIDPDGGPAVEGDGYTGDLLGPPTAPSSPLDLDGWTSSLEREAFEEAVRTIRGHLAAGDCYQVNLTRRLACDRDADPVALFCALRSKNPAPHQALVRVGDVSVVSASPERFLRREGRMIRTRPIKGTGTDPDLLRSSSKDRAENIMITDLARNDLGRVCEYGSVRVPALLELERHPGLYHLVSTVTGSLRPGVGTGRLIEATFPPASVTGCPKPKVLEIIEMLEPVRRGVYCGAVGWIDADRDVLDLNVAIRTFTMTAGRTYLGVGGGIVADSEPDAEWEETELKARRLLDVAAGRA